MSNILNKLNPFHKQEKSEKKEVDRYRLISITQISGGLSMAIPDVNGMRTMLDILDKIPSQRIKNSDRLTYKPIGILYEAVASSTDIG